VLEEAGTAFAAEDTGIDLLGVVQVGEGKTAPTEPTDLLVTTFLWKPREMWWQAVVWPICMLFL
jgi:hypothetical protein